MVRDSWKRRMMKSCEQACLALKLFAQALVHEFSLLQSHSRIKPLINRLIDRAHSTLSELANDAVAILQNCVE